jgi:hypothetical protein
MNDIIRKSREREDQNIKMNLGELKFKSASFALLALDWVQVVELCEYDDKQGISLPAEKQPTLEGRSVYKGVLAGYLSNFLLILCCNH